MSILLLGILSGAAFATLTVLIMLPMKWNSYREKVEAIVAAAVERLIIGFVVVNVQIIPNHPINGLIIGIIMSVPSAIVTRAYLPVIVVGGLGATLVGLVQMLVGV